MNKDCTRQHILNSMQRLLRNYSYPTCKCVTLEHYSTICLLTNCLIHCTPLANWLFIWHFKAGGKAFRGEILYLAGKYLMWFFFVFLLQQQPAAISSHSRDVPAKNVAFLNERQNVLMSHTPAAVIWSQSGNCCPVIILFSFIHTVKVNNMLFMSPSIVRL